MTIVRALIEILCVILLSSPTVIEVINDAKGDYNKDADTIKRLILMTVASLITISLTGRTWSPPLLTFGIFFFFFDYLVTYYLIKNRVVEIKGATWFNYLGKVGRFDNFKVWKRMRPGYRLLIRIIVFATALYFYF